MIIYADEFVHNMDHIVLRTEHLSTEHSISPKKHLTC